MSVEPPIVEYSSAGMKRHCDVVPSPGARKAWIVLRRRSFRNANASSQSIGDHHLNWKGFRVKFVSIRCLQEAAGPCR